MCVGMRAIQYWTNYLVCAPAVLSRLVGWSVCLSWPQRSHCMSVSMPSIKLVQLILCISPVLFCPVLCLWCSLLTVLALQVSCGLCSDPSAEAEPEKVTRYWKQEFDALYAETMAHEGGECGYRTNPSGTDWPGSEAHYMCSLLSARLPCSLSPCVYVFLSAHPCVFVSPSILPTLSTVAHVLIYCMMCALCLLLYVSPSLCGCVCHHQHQSTTTDVPQPRAGLWHRHGFTIVSMLLLSAAISWHISPLTALGST